MNSKGFTLIEMLVTIGLLALAATVIAVNMTGIQSNTNETEIKRFHTKIATSGCMYVDKGQVLKSLDNTTKDLKLGNNTSNCESSYKTRDACKNNSNGCYVCLSTIIDEGLIEDTLYDPETNKKTQEEENEIKVHIKWENNNGYKEKKCYFCRGNDCEG